jgi:hypothetical protein
VPEGVGCEKIFNFFAFFAYFSICTMTALTVNYSAYITVVSSCLRYTRCVLRQGAGEFCSYSPCEKVGLFVLLAASGLANAQVYYAAVAQLAERVLGKDEVMGSIPISS